MGLFSTLRDFTGGYSPLESFLYDSSFGRAETALHDLALARIEPLVAPAARVLDVGCGGGGFAVRLAGRVPGLRVVGLDLSPEQIARARRRAASLSDRVSFVEGTAVDLPFGRGEFDVVYSLGSLKHWPDPARGLRECARVLRPGGRLWVMEGDRGCRHADVHAFISSWDIPAALRPAASAFYRVVVVGQSLDLEDARALLGSLPEIEATVERAPGLPVWVLEGRPRAPEAPATHPSP